jgi:phosphatidylinositol alpha-1,6-mannosyltransferase
VKALIVASEFPPGPGGIGTHAHELARGLSARGWSVAAAVRQDYADPSEIAAFNAALGFDLVTLPGARSERPGRVRRLVRERDADVVVATGAASIWLVAAAPGHRRVAVVHGSELTAGPAARRLLTRRALRRMDGIVCVSRHTLGVLARVGGDTGRRTVIPNGADPERFRPLEAAARAAIRTRLAPGAVPRGPSPGPILLTVGHVSRRKAQDVVIRALPEIAARFPGVIYLVAGLPGRRDEYRRLAESLGVEERVRFLGRVDGGELPRLYAACDVFVLVSRAEGGDFEGYGIAAVEAALAGRPTVATLGSGLAEAVLDGETGLLVPPEDPRATAEAILRLLDDPALAARLGRRALDRARHEQTWRRRIEEYDLFLREVIGRREVSRPPEVNRS